MSLQSSVAQLLTVMAAIVTALLLAYAVLHSIALFVSFDNTEVALTRNEERHDTYHPLRAVTITRMTASV